MIAVSINTYIVSLGFGTHMWTISKENLKTINLDTILVATFGIIATTTSKSSFALTLHRIATNVWMKYFLIFVIVSINISMNLVWIFGFAKCTPLKRVWDKSVPGTCWDPKKLVKFQLFAACKMERTNSVIRWTNNFSQITLQSWISCWHSFLGRSLWECRCCAARELESLSQ